MSVVADVERQLAQARCRQQEDWSPELRASTMTHVVWAPPAWLARAHRVLAGLDERHPARTIVLVPQPRGVARVIAKVDVREFDVSGGAEVLSEVDRAPPARRVGASSGLARPPALDLRLAGVLPLARRAAVGLGRARRAGHGLRPARRRLVRVAGPCPPLRAALGPLRRDRCVRPCVAPRAAVARGPRRVVARHSPGRPPRRRRARGRRGAPRGLVAVAAPPPDPRSRAIAPTR